MLFKGIFEVHSLTYDLYVNDGRVLVVFNLHTHLILPRVAAFGLTYEDDAVAVCVADVDVCWLYGLAVLQPGDLRPGFALQTQHGVCYSAQGDAVMKDRLGQCFTINGTTRLTASPTLRVYVIFKCRGTRILGGSEEEIDHKVLDWGFILGVFVVNISICYHIFILNLQLWSYSRKVQVLICNSLKNNLIGSFQSSPTTSLTRMECWRVRGALAPAALRALTRTKILHPGLSPVMVYLVFSVSSLLDITQSSAEGDKQSNRKAICLQHSLNIPLLCLRTMTNM